MNKEQFIEKRVQIIELFRGLTVEEALIVADDVKVMLDYKADVIDQLQGREAVLKALAKVRLEQAQKDIEWK